MYFVRFAHFSDMMKKQTSEKLIQNYHLNYCLFISEQFLKNKLMMAFIAAVLIINLIKFKVLFLLPMMMGVGPAKKVMMKILLFLFPALSHIFKLCHYYHSNYHSTKFVHHQHHIKHLHHTVRYYFVYSFI